MFLLCNVRLSCTRGEGEWSIQTLFLYLNTVANEKKIRVDDSDSLIEQNSKKSQHMDVDKCLLVQNILESF